MRKQPARSRQLSVKDWVEHISPQWANLREGDFVYRNITDEDAFLIAI